ncbi:MAG: AAA family ATPase [Pseudomonadota bacterium]
MREAAQATSTPTRPNLSLWREGPEATVELSLILEDDPPRNDVVDWEPTPDVTATRDDDMVTLDAYDPEAPGDDDAWPTTVAKGQFTLPRESDYAPRESAPALRAQPRNITRQRYAEIEEYAEPPADAHAELAEERVELSAAAAATAEGTEDAKPSFLSVLAGVTRRGDRQRKGPQSEFVDVSAASAHERATKLYVRSLTRVGVSQPLVHELATAATASSTEPLDWPALAGQANARLRTLDQEVVDRGGVVALVGPTGVGKTTSIAKLAARFALKHGRDRLALITTDTFRVGAHEQLNTFARILGVPLFQADDPKTFSSLMRRLSRHRLVLIDTAGMGQRDLRLAEELSLLSRSRANVQVLLTLSANTERRTMLDTIERFAEVKPAGCVLTKMDETRATGTALSALIETGLPLAYTSNGQNVPEDLHWARSKRLSLVQQVFHQADLECRDEFDDTDDEVRESA